MQLRLKYFTCLRKTDWKTAPRAHTLHSAILRCALFVFGPIGAEVAWLVALRSLPLLGLRTAVAQRARKSQVAVAIALQSVNTKEASNACVNERCKTLRSLNRVFVFEIVLCIGASSKDPARFVELGFRILRNKEAHEYKSSSQETNPQQVVASWVAGRSIFEINLRRRQLDLDFDLQWSGPSTMQLCCTSSETVCFVIHPCITNFRFR